MVRNILQCSSLGLRYYTDVAGTDTSARTKLKDVVSCCRNKRAVICLPDLS